jgi:signal peptidase II
MNGNAVRACVFVAAAIVLVDQATKVLMVEWLDGGSRDLIGEFLQFRVTRNPGSAFSLFTGGGQIIAVIAIVIAIGVVVALPRMPRRIERIALAMVMGGALGNLTDRVFRGDGVLDGAVIDFIDFSFFPSFNVADSCITIGVALLMISGFFLAPDAAPHGDAVGSMPPEPDGRGDG